MVTDKLNDKIIQAAFAKFNLIPLIWELELNRKSLHLMDFLYNYLQLTNHANSADNDRSALTNYQWIIDIFNLREANLKVVNLNDIVGSIGIFLHNLNPFFLICLFSISFKYIILHR